MPQFDRREFESCNERRGGDLPDNWRRVEIANSEGVVAIQRTDVDHYITNLPRTINGKRRLLWVLLTQSDGFSHALPLQFEMTGDSPNEWEATREWLIQESHEFTPPRTEAEAADE